MVTKFFWLTKRFLNMEMSVFVMDGDGGQEEVLLSNADNGDNTYKGECVFYLNDGVRKVYFILVFSPITGDDLDDEDKKCRKVFLEDLEELGLELEAETDVSKFSIRSNVN